MEAYVNGVSTRSVDDLVAALGVDSGISKSRGVEDLCRTRRDRRRLPHPPARSHRVPLRVSRRHLPARAQQASQVCSMAVVVATGITADGSREVLGLDVGDSEDEVFWRGFLRSLKARGLGGVRLVISDQHSGLVAALKRSFQGTVASTLPRPFRAQPVGPRPQVASGHGRCRVPHDLRSTRRRHRGLDVGRSPRPARCPLPQDRPR